MAQLSEKDLALLSSLIYCDRIVEQKSGTSLSKVINYLWDTVTDESLSDSEKLKKIGKLYGDFGDLASKNEAEAVRRFKEDVLEQIKNSPALMSLKIVRPLKNDKTTSGITAACFVDDISGAATVVFRGTDSSYKAWFDNFEGAGTTISTPMQEAARKYIDSLEYENITVTGHSKGGNLATYVAILCPNVAKSVSFDGQGFSEAFHNKYADMIAESLKYKDIKTIAAYNDFVNILLVSVGSTVYVKNDAENFFQRHYITNIIRDNDFDTDGNFSSVTEQGTDMKIADTVVDGLVYAMSANYEEWFTDTLGSIGSAFLGKDNMTGDDVLRLVYNTWGDTPVLLYETGKGLWETIKNFGITIWYGLKDLGTGLWDILFSFNGQKIFEGIFKVLWGIVLVLYSILETGINLIIDAINLVINAVIAIINDIGKIAEWIGGVFGQDWGWHFDFTSVFSKLPLPNESLWETGGFPAIGQPFIARESGPEFVGSLNNRTVVVNKNQIIEAVSTGVYGACMSALNEKTCSAQAIARVFLDGRQIAIAGQS